MRQRQSRLEIGSNANLEVELAPILNNGYLRCKDKHFTIDKIANVCYNGRVSPIKRLMYNQIFGRRGNH